jgi:small subunit ribosomal protein S20
VPNVKSARKRVKTNEIRRLRNRSRRAVLKTSMKKVLSAASPEEAAPHLRRSISLLDRYVCRGLVHRNNAARRKARLMNHVNRLGS